MHLWSVRLTGSSLMPASTAVTRGRNAGTASATALRRILAGYLGVSDAEVPLTRAPGGKPVLEGGAGPAFNLSHSGPLALIAVSARSNVGVDIEQLGGRSREGLLRRVLGPAEEAVVRALPPGERERAFLRHWTAKEACVKARGIGLTKDLKQLLIADALDHPVASGLGMDDLCLQHHDPCALVLGTVAVSGGPWRAVPLDYRG